MADPRVKLVMDRILVQPLVDDTRTKGGLYVPENIAMQTKYTFGRVVEASPGFYSAGQFIPLCVKKDDIICYQRPIGEDVKVDGETYVLLLERDIQFIVLPKEE